MTGLAFVVPAAGKGKRMQASFPGVPKALVPLAGKPMIHHVLDTIGLTALASRVVIVSSPRVEHQLRDALQDRDVSFATQKIPLGTGDAVRAARAVLRNEELDMVVTCADQPLISAELIQRLVSTHQLEGSPITMATVLLEDFEGWRSAFFDWGRVIRDGNRIINIIEACDASPAQLQVREVNPSVYCFRAPWIWEVIDELGTDNAQREYLLTDVVPIAVRKGIRVSSVTVANPRETLGANSPAQLATLEEIYRLRTTAHTEGASSVETGGHI